MRSSSLDIKDDKPKGAEIQALLQPTSLFPASYILKKFPSIEIWRFFIDGHQQKQKMSDTASGFTISTTPPFPAELLNLTCIEFYRIYDTCSLESTNNLELLIAKIKKPLQEVVSGCRHRLEHETITFKEAFIAYNSKDQGWLGFERREEGYLFALCQALAYALNPSFQLDLDHIISLHNQATQDVKNLVLNIGNKNAAIAPGFGYIGIRFRFFDSTDLKIPRKSASIRKTFDRVIEKIYSGKHNYLSILFQGKDDETWSITSESRSNEAVEVLFEKVSRSPNIYLYSRIASDQIRNDMINSFIHKFDFDLNACGDDFYKKIAVIVIFIQDLNHLHPFIDGNTRAFSIILLNQLLLKYGFLPTILNDPNDFEKDSVEELTAEIILGMKRVLRLCLGDSIYDITTKELIDECTQAQKKYFLKSINTLSEYFQPIEDAKANLQADVKSISAITTDQVVDLMFDLYTNKLLTEKLLNNFIDKKTRDYSYNLGKALLANKNLKAALGHSLFYQIHLTIPTIISTLSVESVKDIMCKK